MPTTSPSPLERIAGGLKKLVVGLAALIAVPQDLIVRQGAPAIWQIIRSLLRIGRTELSNALALAEIWIRTYGPRFWRFFRTGFLVCFAMIALGIWLKANVDREAGYVVGLLGAIALQFLLLLLYALGSSLSYVVMVHLGVAKGLLKGAAKIVEAASLGTVVINASDLVPLSTEEKTKVKTLHQKYKESFAILVLISAALLPIEIFLSWRAVLGTLFLIAVALPAVWATIHLGGEFGAVMKVIRKVSLYTLVFFLVAFLAMVLFPKSFGSWNFGAIDDWLGRRNTTEAVIGLAVFVIAAMFFISLFAKEEKSASSWRKAAKMLAPIAAIGIVVLMYKGSLSYEQATGHEVPKIDFSFFKKSDKDDGDLKPSYARGNGAGLAPTATPADARYLSPPVRNLADVGAMDAQQQDDDQPVATPRRARPLPPKPDPKKVQSLGEGLEALDKL